MSGWVLVAAILAGVPGLALIWAGRGGTSLAGDIRLGIGVGLMLWCAAGLLAWGAFERVAS